MANISAQDVYKLRDITGVGVMDCKNALVEAEGDIEKAIEILRKKGQKLANKRAERDANEGIVYAFVNDSKQAGAVLMLNCETDFVGKNEDFIKAAKQFCEVGVYEKAKTLDELLALKIDGLSIADKVTDLVGKIGEKIQVAHYEFIEAPLVAAYNHHTGRVATLLGLSADSAEIEVAAKDITMQIAAMSPIAIDKDDVSAEVVAKEIEIGKEQARQDGKPEEMLEKIAMGKLNKFYQESTLLNQDYIKDGSMKVRDFLASVNKDLKVLSFKRLALGA